MREADLRHVAAAFVSDGDRCPISPLGRGHINDTYLVASADRPLVLQRINPRVFPEPMRVIENFFLVSNHLRRIGGKRYPAFRCAEPVPTLAGGVAHDDGRGGLWRGQSFLHHQTIAAVSTSQQARELGRALATLHLLLEGLETHRLIEPLPGFHYLPGYLADYEQVAMLSRERGGEVDDCHQAVAAGRDAALELEIARKSGLLRTRPIHGDPKIDNVLFANGGCACGFLDLDTVMVGLPHYDLGDCLRSSCNRGGEEPAIASPLFSLDICRAILEGYAAIGAGLLSAPEAAYIFNGVLTITYALGVRFFTDHLRGDRYFKVGCRGDNLRRALAQFALVEDIRKKETAIRRLTKDIWG